MSSRTALPLYIASRAVTLSLLFAHGAPVVIGVAYGHLALDELGTVQGLWEYPWPLAALADIPYRLGATTEIDYIAAWILAALAIDAAFLWRLWRAGGSQMSPGMWLWLLALPACGPLVLGTYDLLPAVATGAALLALRQARPGWAGGWLGVATALKLYPIAGIPALALPGTGDDRRAAIVAFFAVGFGAALATLVAGGPMRLMSPLVWQQQRGLQAEALAALPLLWARHLDGGTRWTTAMSAHQTTEVQGPGVDIALQSSSAAMFVGLLFLLLLYVRAFRAPAEARQPALAARLILLSILVLILTNKVFSPQHMVWLGPSLAVLGVIAGTRETWRDGVLFLAACVLTQVVFPHNYEAIAGHAAGVTRAWALGVLTARDIVLVILAGRLVVQIWRGTARRIERG